MGDRSLRLCHLAGSSTSVRTSPRRPGEHRVEKRSTSPTLRVTYRDPPTDNNSGPRSSSEEALRPGQRSRALEHFWTKSWRCQGVARPDQGHPDRRDAADRRAGAVYRPWATTPKPHLFEDYPMMKGDYIVTPGGARERLAQATSRGVRAGRYSDTVYRKSVDIAGQAVALRARCGHSIWECASLR